MYVDYLTFSHLNPITNPTPAPAERNPNYHATLTIGATARNPYYRSSRVYPNYRGSRTQPLLSGLPHAINPNGRGSRRARPGRGWR